MPLQLPRPALALALALAAAAAAQAPAWRLGPASLSGQMNLVWQGYPAFAAAAGGPLSLPPAAEWRNTRVLTLSTTTALAPGWQLQLDLEAANGRALGGATGLAAITNLDVTRNLAASLAPSVYLARLLVQRQQGDAVIRVGRLDLADDFDRNSVLGDDHRQFLNWSFNVNPAWDYAADTRGYTDAVEYLRGGWQLAYALLPRTVNGMRLDWHSSALIAERRWNWGPATLGLLGYANHAALGRYDQAGTDIEAVHRWVWKPGAGVDAELPLGTNLRLGARWGVNDDAIEEYANTEAGNAASLGVTGHFRSNRLGLAIGSNGISAAHAAYLARGGLGFLLGDDSLRYGRENLAETFWTRPLGRWASWGPDAQWILHPGYNRARGPVLVLGLRAHADF